MNLYPDYSQIIYRYINNKLIGKVYQGEELTYKFIETYRQNLPIKFKSLFFNYLLNYKIYGTSMGTGVETENLAPPLSEWKDGYITANGSIGSASVTNKERYSPKIPVEPNATYQWAYETGRFPSGENGAWSGLGWYDNNNSFISRNSGVVNTVLEVVAPANAAYVRLSFHTYDKEYNTMFIKSTAPSTYIPYGYKLPLTVESGAQSQDIPIYIGSSKLGAEEYVDYAEQKVHKRTENLWDGEWQVGYWALSDGQHRDSTHWVCSLNKFPCVAGSAYSFKYFDNSRYYSIGWYDSNDTYISMDSEQNSGDTGYRTFTAVAPNNAAYMAISIGSYPGEYDLIDPSTAATLTLVSGSTPPETYIPYLQPTDPPVEFPAIPTYKDENTLSTNISLGEVTIKGRIESITPPESIIYGYHINPNESDPSACITYIEDAIGKNPASMGTTTFDYGDWENAFFIPRPCMVKYDGTVDYYLNPNDYTKKEDGSNSDISNINYQGNAMMQWPKIYWKYESGQTEGEGYFYVSNIQVDNSYKCWCNIDSKNNEIDYFYTAIYNGTSAPTYDNTATYNIGDYVTYTDTTYTNGALYQCNTAITTAEEFDSTKWTLINASSPLRSLSGIQTNQANGCGYLSGTIQENRALANNTTADTEWYFDVLSDRMLINGLLILIGKSLNIQAVFGNGITSGSEAGKNAYVTGSLNDKGLFYGDVSGTTTAVKVFGMENWWGHTWHRTAGLIGGANNTYLYKLTYNNYDGSASTSYNSTGTGYLTAISNNTATNIIRPSNSVDDTTVYWYNKAAYGKWGYLPIQIGGSSTTYYADYYYNGTGYLLVGGSSSHGAYAGASYFHLSRSFANAPWSIGAALSLKPLALGAKA